jgi:hypothetical protein
MCCAWTVARDPAIVAFATPRRIKLEVALKVGKVRKLTETITPQVPGPPPRRA